MCALVALAFLVPLGLSLQGEVRDEALADAARRGAMVTGALAVSTEPTAVRRAVEATGDDPATRPVVHGLAGEQPAGRASTADLEQARGEAQSRVVDVDGGLVRLDPVVLDGRVAVVEVFVPTAVLDEGAGGTWLLLAGVAVALVGAAVIVVDRVAARAVDSTRGLVRAALAVGDGDLGVRVDPTGPRELAEAGYAFNRMADRLVAARTDERELVADLSHRLRTPLTVLRLDAEGLDSDDTSVGSFSPAELDRRRTIRRIRQAIVTLEGRSTSSSRRPARRSRTRPGRPSVTSARWSGTGWCSGRRWPATRTDHTGSAAPSCGFRCRCPGPSWPPPWTR